MDMTAKAAALKEQAKELRKIALTMIYEAQSGHPGGAFSAAEIVTALYFDEMDVSPENPKRADRDRFILSKGHVCPIQYAALAKLGYFPMETIHTLRKMGSILQGHPDMKKCPGIDISTGSLGQGLSCGVGMALAVKRDGLKSRVFAIVGDGECNEGQIWEAIQAAVKYELNNLVVFIDINGLQCDGTCEEIMPPVSLGEKFKAFGCATYHINGNCMEEVLDVLDKIRASSEKKPHVILAKTIKGRGVSYMENVVEWHGMAPNDEQYKIAMAELEGGLQ